MTQLLIRRRAYGFTLVEMMVTLAILAIAMAFASPSLTSWQRNSQLGTSANALLIAMNSARSEAMSRGVPVAVQRTGANWSGGFQVYVDANVNGQFDANETVLQTVGSDQFPSYLTVSASSNSQTQVVYAASGFLSQSTGQSSSFTLTLQRNDVASADVSQIRRVVVSLAGRTRICRPVSTSDANCSPSAETE